MNTLKGDIAALLNDAASLRKRGHIRQAFNSVRLARAFRLGCSPRNASNQLRAIVSRNANLVASLVSPLIVAKTIKVDVWPNGYADDNGLRTIEISENANPQNEAIKAFGFMARVAGLSRVTRQIAPVSPDAAKAYTLRDNS